MHEIPAPNGLYLVLEAAQRTGLSGHMYRRAEAAVQSFERLIGDMPGGLATIDTALMGWLPEIRHKSERYAKQAAFKAMSTLYGYQADTLASSVVIAPSATAPDRCDHIFAQMVVGLRRLRPGCPVSVFGFRYKNAGSSSLIADQVPSNDSVDPRNYILQKYSSATLPEIHSVHKAPHIDSISTRMCLSLGKTWTLPSLAECMEICFDTKPMIGMRSLLGM